jgi:hypothetical protein
VGVANVAKTTWGGVHEIGGGVIGNEEGGECGSGSGGCNYSIRGGTAPSATTGEAMTAAIRMVAVPTALVLGCAQVPQAHLGVQDMLGAACAHPLHAAVATKPCPSDWRHPAQLD